MATLQPPELQTARQACASTFSAVAYTKPQINAALQAIENAMTTTTMPAGAVGLTIPAIISTAIDAATTPFVFTGPQKKVLFALWARLKFERDK
jgi:hypothetical protein